ncbi:IDEAL domain-containing protein [Cytobacillus praedii]|uniref:IDEAL domain-containing protein n=1 Tax=Cytobacillus praedii TaxID=1742358 RepID=UPI002E1F6FF2|nr:IDEAL domain-containing protein [Cytobacillus praedii]
MNEKSYTELMKKSAMKKKQLKESFVLDLYIDMLLSEILLKKEKAKLMEKIDEAIDTENKRAFNSLSKQYLDLTKRFGT